MSTPETDVVLTLHATRQYPAEKDFIQCVDTLCEHTKNFRFIFVDDQCDPEARAILEQTAARFRSSVLIRTHFQHWFTRAVNLGLRLVQSPWAIILNADTILGLDWLEELYSVRDEAQTICGMRVGLVGSTLSGEELRRWSLSKNPDYVTGHCWLASMAALTEASNNRGTPGMYLDMTNRLNIHIRSDIEISWRLNALNWACVKSFKSPVGHTGGKSWGHNLHAIQNLTLQDVSYKYY
jgi:cellulose synthase/poly-beta-1,6-N-acetylglucosamine synthase-like glycosyltransferase